jgi:Kef-type K+ transport system membrane component KefB
MKLLTGELILEDIIAVIGITFVSSFAASKALSAGNAFSSIAVSMLLLGLAYLLAERTLVHLSRLLARYRKTEILLFFSLSLCFAMSMIAVSLGLSAAIGAFLAGSLISSMKVGHPVKKVTESLGLAFSSIFFISIGMLTDPALIAASLPIFILILAVQAVACALATYFAGRTIGMAPPEAAFSASAMLVLGEFSLLFARIAAPESSIDLVGLASLGVLASSLLSYYAVKRFSMPSISPPSLLPSRMEARFSMFFAYTADVLNKLEYGGPVHSTVMREIRERRSDLWRIAVSSAIVLAAFHFLPNFTFSADGYSVTAFDAALALLAIVLFHSLMRTLASLLSIVSLLEKTFAVRSAKDSLRGLETNMGVALAFVMLALATPFAVSVLSLPPELALVRFGFLLAAAFFAWIGITSVRGRVSSAKR